ncbi:MAG: sugar phosphate isomerase/epimerase, partial [bacterium]|nr:sugar phosphate isomerase/epimerase [bacterium]
MTRPLTLKVGVKTDPIEYRYSFEWLFRIMAEEGVRHVQLGTFFEIYQLPDESFRELRRQAENFGLQISSIFTAHRELGGFYRVDPAWEEVARRNYARLIEVGGLVGARSVGSNPGATLRDQMGLKDRGIRRYLDAMKELLHHARRYGVEVLAVEPMSCLAEPPTLPDEMREMIEELWAYHNDHPGETATAGLCTDVSHGYADRDRVVQHDHMALLEAALPYTTEMHLKNTDAIFGSTFGFGEAERQRGVVDIPAIRDLLLRKADRLPVGELIGYLEVGGPKTGRDYSDCLLEEELRASLRYVKEAFSAEGGRPAREDKRAAVVEIATPRPAEPAPAVLISSSISCARPA